MWCRGPPSFPKNKTRTHDWAIRHMRGKEIQACRQRQWTTADTIASASTEGWGDSGTGFPMAASIAALVAVRLPLPPKCERYQLLRREAEKKSVMIPTKRAIPAVRCQFGMDGLLERPIETSQASRLGHAKCSSTLLAKLHEILGNSLSPAAWARE